jgi:hypothetical protein
MLFNTSFNYHIIIAIALSEKMYDKKINFVENYGMTFLYPFGNIYQ